MAPKLLLKCQLEMGIKVKEKKHILTNVVSKGSPDCKKIEKTYACKHCEQRFSLFQITKHHERTFFLYFTYLQKYTSLEIYQLFPQK